MLFTAHVIKCNPFLVICLETQKSDCVPLQDITNHAKPVLAEENIEKQGKQL